VTFGIEPLVAYILRRQIEIKLVRTAVLAKLDGFARSDVEERLRVIHV
jgi:vacuolar-type H+-ATPase subunit C/Vma6